MDDSQVIEKLRRLCESHPNRGFDNYSKNKARALNELEVEF